MAIPNGKKGVFTNDGLQALINHIPVEAEQTQTSSSDGGTNTTTFKNKNGDSLGTISVRNGSTGIGVSTTEINYGVSTSSTTQPSSWYTNVQSADEGQYLWTRVRLKYTNNTYSSYFYSVAKQGTTGDLGQRGSKWFSGTALSGTSIGISYTWSDSEQKYVGDMYLNTTKGYVYKCTTAGTYTTAKWRYQGNIKGTNGTNGTNGKDAGTYVVTTTAELNAAVTALNSSAGGKIILREGTYTLTNTLQPTANIIFEGMGDSTIITSTIGDGFVYSSGNNKIVFKNMKIHYTATGGESCFSNTNGTNGITDFDNCTINITIKSNKTGAQIFNGCISNSNVTLDYQYAIDDCAVLLDHGRISNSTVKIYNNTNSTTGSGTGGELYIIGSGEVSNCDLTVAGRTSNSQRANVCGYSNGAATISCNKITLATNGSVTKQDGYGGAGVICNNIFYFSGSGTVYITGAISGNRFEKSASSRIVYVGEKSTFNGNVVLNRSANDFQPYNQTAAVFGNVFLYACTNLGNSTYNKW